jgi:hypothetical protein
VPDFIVRLDDGRGPDDPLHLVVETKGFRGLDANFKAETMRALFVPGVNRLGAFGRWGFVELRDAFEIEAAFGEAVKTAIAEARREREKVGAERGRFDLQDQSLLPAGTPDGLPPRRPAAA